MTVNLIRLIEEELGEDLTRQLKPLLGEQYDSAYKAAIPSILAAIAHKATSGEGSKELLVLLQREGIELIGKGKSTNALVQSPLAQELMKEGLLSLKVLLVYPERVESMIELFAKALGLDDDSSSKLLTALTPLVLRVLGKFAKEQKLSKESLASTLDAQRIEIELAAPPLLGGLLEFKASTEATGRMRAIDT